MNGENIGELLKELNAIDVLGLNPSDKRKKKCDAIKLFAESVFEAARDTYPMDATFLYKDFEDYFVNN